MSDLNNNKNSNSLHTCFKADQRALSAYNPPRIKHECKYRGRISALAKKIRISLPFSSSAIEPERGVIHLIILKVQTPPPQWMSSASPMQAVYHCSVGFSPLCSVHQNGPLSSPYGSHALYPAGSAGGGNPFQIQNLLYYFRNPSLTTRSVSLSTFSFPSCVNAVPAKQAFMWNDDTGYN